jgi:hypothetical protein
MRTVPVANSVQGNLHTHITAATYSYLDATAHGLLSHNLFNGKTVGATGLCLFQNQSLKLPLFL